MDLKEQIMDYMKKNKRFILSAELKKELNVKGEQQTNLFFDALKTLIEEGSLFFDEKKGYKIFTNDLGYAYGEIEINKSGNGFIHTKDGHIIFISNEDLNGALDGDLVIISSIDFGRKKDFKGVVYKVLKRKNGNVMFEVIGNGYKSTLVPCNKNEIVPITINKNEYKNLIEGDIVLVKIGTEKIDGEYISTITKTIGQKTDKDIDIKMIYEKYNIDIDFSKEALEEAKNLPTSVDESDLKGRVDLRNLDVVTIDCDNTKDRDDAVYVEKLPNGNYRLYTCISSVNYYVKKGTKLYEECLKRITSFYPNNTCNPLFPTELSNGICSLNEGVDRLTKTCEIEINKFGEVVDSKIYNSVINSKKAMKYSEVNRVLNGELIEGYEKFEEQLNLLKELNDALMSARRKRNCIDFGINDIGILEDERGNVEKFETRGSGLAESIIENCMLITGTSVAEQFSWLPFVYRVHEEPNQEIVKQVIETLRKSGFKINRYNNINEKTINEILNSITDIEQAKIVRVVLLRAMKKAKYDVNNVGHFALQLLKYCHFTAPIRRCSDFMIHTLIDELETFDYSRENILKLEKELINVCENASEKEKISKKIEEEALLMSMAEYMEKHIGEGYNAIITEVYPHGMFVRTKNLISGKVKFENMYDDRFCYDYEKNVIIGKKTKKKYKIGDKVWVVVKDACKETRTIDFEIGKQKSLRI